MFCVKPSFFFRNSEREKHVSWSIFTRDEKTFHLLKIIIFIPPNPFSTSCFEDHLPQVWQYLKLLGSPLSTPSRRHPLTTDHLSTSCCKIPTSSCSSNRCQSFSLSFRLSMTSTFTKSSLTVDTAFRKDLSLQGVHFTHTYQPTLNATSGSTIPGSAGRVWFGHDLQVGQMFAIPCPLD